MTLSRAASRSNHLESAGATALNVSVLPRSQSVASALDARNVPGASATSDPRAPPDAAASDPFESISRAIQSVKVRTSARLRTRNALRYVRVGLQYRERLLARLLVLIVAAVLFSLLAAGAHRVSNSFLHGAVWLDDIVTGSWDESEPATPDLDLRDDRPPGSSNFDVGPWLIGMVTDLDAAACRKYALHSKEMRPARCRDAAVWVSYFKRGVLRVDGSSNDPDAKFSAATLDWLDELEMDSRDHQKDSRGMELSELEYFRGHLLAPDDRGTLYEITSARGMLDERAQPEIYGAISNIPPSALSRAKLYDGDGHDTDLFFKSEWYVACYLRSISWRLALFAPYLPNS